MSFVLLTIQEARHLYVKFGEPPLQYTRMLLEDPDEFNELKNQTTEALESELKGLRQNNKEERKRNRGEDKQIRQDRDDDAERRQSRIEQVLMEREQRSSQLHEVHFYWWFGLGCCVVGVIFFLTSNSWLGIAMMIVGYLEMIFWTFPSYRVFSSGGEFERLLTWKLIYNSASLFMLISLWAIFLKYDRRKRAILDK